MPEARRRLSPAGEACPGFRAAGSGRGSPLPCDLSFLSPLKDEMAANTDGTLTGHVFTDFIHHLRGGQFPLPGIAAAGINQGFVLAQDIAALWCKFHVLSP